jgi:predicted HTH domain antitoxin
MLTRKVQQGKHDEYIYCNREQHLDELQPRRLPKHMRYIADEKKEDMSAYQGREKINMFNFIYNNS